MSVRKLRSRLTADEPDIVMEAASAAHVRFGWLRNFTFACFLAVGAIAPNIALGQISTTDSSLSTGYREDFEAAWTFVRDNYAYFFKEKTDWPKVRALYASRAASTGDDREFIGVLEDMLEELYDPHATLGINTASSPRLVPSGTDLWAEWQDGHPVITAVRAGSEAERVGLRSGMEVLLVNGQPVREIVEKRLPKALRSPDPAASDWALRAVLAGRHNAVVRLSVRADKHEQTFDFRPGLTHPPTTLLTTAILDGNIGYVRLHNSLGEERLIADWDRALTSLRDTHGLVLDLRDTPSGGNTTVARAIMSRLISKEHPYQRHELPAEEQRYGVRRIWVEYVAPRGPFTNDKPMTVLVGRWTGSMGEGLAIGFDAMQRATIIGTQMARLQGEIGGITLPHTKIDVRIPVARLYHVNGQPREEFSPRIVVPPEGPEADSALAAALKLLRSSKTE
ncbi:MAG: peptidase [Proteobacteria bacterium]|nr:peptidase [Pseudomonadota bacterium]